MSTRFGLTEQVECQQVHKLRRCRFGRSDTLMSCLKFQEGSECE